MCDYIGSKRKLTPWIFEEILRSVGSSNLSGHMLVDACSGSGWVSREAAGLGAEVVAGDLMALSGIMVEGSIGVDRKTIAIARKIIPELNALRPIRGYFYENYSPAGGRKYMTCENAERLDAMRDAIDVASGENEKLRKYLLYCLLESFSRVMNTSGHTVSFLKQFKDRALDRMLLRMEEVYPGKATFVLGDVVKTVGSSACASRKKKVLYMDPPYNDRQYGNNYHLYETIVRNDKPSIPPVGESICGYRNWRDESKSGFCSRDEGKVLALMAEVVSNADPDVAFMSYSSDSTCGRDEIVSTFESRGYSVETHSKQQARYNGHKDGVVNVSPLREYLFEVRPG